eukprot:scaffold145112_cov30-Tisochrysis_lutea.AAC.3
MDELPRWADVSEFNLQRLGEHLDLEFEVQLQVRDLRHHPRVGRPKDTRRGGGVKNLAHKWNNRNEAAVLVGVADKLLEIDVAHQERLVAGKGDLA